MDKKGQVWVETVLYTLIGVVIITMVLAFANPQIKKYQDRQAYNAILTSLNELDTQIGQVYRFGAGNRREILVYLSDGNLEINAQVFKGSGCGADDRGTWDYIEVKIEGTNYMAGQEGRDVPVPGTNFWVETTFNGRNFDVALRRYYNCSRYNLKYIGEEDYHVLSPSAGGYRLFVENLGKPTGKEFVEINIILEHSR